MEVQFNVTKEGRKALVKAVSEVTGLESAYQGAPGFAYKVGGYIIGRDGTLVLDGQADAQDIPILLAGLAERGFVCECDISETAPAVSGGNETVADGLASCEVIPDSGGGASDHSSGDGTGDMPSGVESCNATAAVPDGGSGMLTISMPMSGFAASSLDNLEKLVAAKAWIIKKMSGADALPIERDGEKLHFPWFNPDATPEEVGAYSLLISGLCETAKQKKRVTATEKPLEDGDNEKFKARCFLLSLGFIGKEYSQARKILLAPMSGSGSHKSGSHTRPAATETAIATDSGVESPESANIRKGSYGDDAVPACGEAAA